MVRRIVYHGGTRWERNRFVFERALERHSHPAFDFLYLVRNPLRRRQLEAMYMRKHASSFEIPVLTLRGFVNRLLDGSDQRPPLSATTRLVILEEIMASRKSPFPEGPIGAGRRLKRVAREIFNLKLQNILEPELIAPAGLDGPRTPWTEELAWCFTRYQTRLQELGLEDWAGQLALAYRGLLTGKIEFEKRFCDLRSLCVEGFSDLLPLEHALFRLLRDRVPEFVVSSDFQPPGEGPDEASSFGEMGKFLGDTRLEWQSVEHRRVGLSPRVVCLPGPEEEVSWIAEKVARLQPDRHTVALVSAKPDSYRRDLRRALSKRDIHLTEPGCAPAGSRMMLDLVRGYLELIVAGFPRRLLFDFLSHPRFDPGFTADDLNRLEKWARVCDVQRGLRNWTIHFPRTVEAIRSGLPDDDPRTRPGMLSLAASFSRLMSRLNPDLEEGSAGEWLSLLERRLGPFLKAAPWADLRALRGANQILQNMLREIRLLQDHYPAPLRLRQFARLIELFPDSVVQEVDFEAPLTVLTTPDEVAHLEVDVLIWMGLSESEFTPGFSSLADVQRGGRASETWEDQVRAREHRFGWIGGQARSCVVYTCPERFFGTTTVPSPLLRGFPLEKRNWTKSLPLTPARARPNVRRGRRAVQLREGSEASVFDGVVSPNRRLTALRQGPGGRRVSITPSLLEEYMRCGFRFLAEHHLGLQQETKELELTGGTLGGLLHRVLHRFVRGLDPPRLRSLSAWDRLGRRRLLDILEEELAALPFREVLRRNSTWSTQEELLRSGLHPDEPGSGVLSDFLTQQATWLRRNQVADLEKKLAPLSLGKIETDTHSQVEVVLTGTVDRVDRSPKGLRIIDYKTGKVPLRRLYQGWGFQLPLYYLLVRNHYGEKVENAFFFRVQPPLETGLKTVAFPDQDKSGWAVLARYYREKALEAVQSLLSGKFPVTLVGAAQAGCRECSFRDICRKDAGKAADLKGSGRFPIARAVITRGSWAVPETREREVSGA